MASQNVMAFWQEETAWFGRFHPEMTSNIGHGHKEGLRKHGYIAFSTKKWITFAVHE